MRTLRYAALVSVFATLTAVAQQPNQPIPPISGSMPTGSLTTQTSGTAAASLKGSITDPEGAVIPGATITLTPSKGKAIVQQSGQDGSYIVHNVPAGTYSVTVTMQGFSSAVKQGVKFGVGQAMTMNVKLAIEEQATEVNVTTNANQVSVDADSNASAMVIKDKDLDALSDDPDELSSELSALAGPAAGPNGGQIYVDGFTGGQLPPKSSIREIRINQNPFSAQYDKPGFGRVEILTKPGSDAYHGQATVMGNYSAFNTSSPFLGATNNFPSYFTIFTMGSLSGPLTKSSSFSINGSYRDNEDNSTITATILSHSADDPTLCAPGDLTCSVYPYPTAFRAVPKPAKRFDITPRLDFALSDKNTLTVRYRYEQGTNRNNGIGTYALPTAASNADSSESELSISDNQVFSTKVVNETRFQYRRGRSSSYAQSNAPSVKAQSTFTGGGSASGSNSNHSDHIEVQNYASISLAKNFIRFGGRMRYDREALWSNSGQNGTFTYSQFTPAATDAYAQANCTQQTGGSVFCTAADAYRIGRPSQYLVTQVNNPRAGGSTTDVGLYAEDDWKVKPNFTLSYGLRYETQNVIHSNRDFAPRVSLAYGIPRKGGASPVTVIRAGYGIFYDRFDLSNIITTYSQNGTNQVQNTFKIDPTAVPSAPCAPGNTTGCGSGAAGVPVKYTLGNIRSEYNMQYAVGVDQQLGRTATASFNYISANGVHTYMSRSIAPSATQLQYQFQSAGVYHQNELMANVRWNPSRAISLVSYYVYTNAKSNANGAGTFPTDSTNPKTDYGRAAFSNTNRFVLFGSFSLPYAISASPIMNLTSGAPYSVTTGTDVNGDSIFNDRAYFTSGRTSGDCKNINDFTTDPTGNVLTPVNYCTGPTNFRMDLRVGKSFGFGEKRNVAGNAGGDQSGRGNRGSGGGGGRGGRGGGGAVAGGPMMMGGGGGSNNHRYNFNLGAQFFNLFNVVPYGTPVGSLANASNFGKSLQLSSGGFGGTTSAVRRIMLQLSFNF